MAITFANLPDGLNSMALFDQAFAAVPYTPQGGVSSNTVQGAITELDTKKASISSLASIAFSGASPDFITNQVAWTPVLTFATPGDVAVTYTTQVGRYVQLSNNMVWASVNVTTSSFTWTTSSGNFKITGLPFTSQNTAGLIMRGPVQFGGINKAGYSQLSLGMSSNTTGVFNLNASGMGVGISTVAAADVPSGGTVVINGNIIILL